MKTKTSPDLLTSAECAERLRIHPATVARWVARGVVPGWRIGRVLRVRWSDILRVAGGDRRDPETVPMEERSDG